MAQIKKITDKQGNDIYLRTHTKAVVDDNGYTAESRLQAMQDEINQAQLAVGAVPSDLTPTKGSTNWVTSEGILNFFNSKLNMEVVSNYVELGNFTISGTKWSKQPTTSGLYSVAYPLLKGVTYRLTAKSTNAMVYAIVDSIDNISNNSSVSFNSNWPERYLVSAGSVVYIEIPSDSQASHIVLRKDTTTNGATYESVASYKKIPYVINSLESTDADNALSALQGKILKDSIGYVGTEQIIDTDNTTIVEDYWVGNSTTPNVWISASGYSSKVIVIPENTRRIRLVNKTIYSGNYTSIPVFFMKTCTAPSISTSVDFAEGYTKRVILYSTPIEIQITDCKYLAIGYHDGGANINYSYDIECFTSIPISEKIEEIEERIDNIHNDSIYFTESDLTPIISDDNTHILIYEADTLSNSNYLCNAVSYPNGIIIAARSGVGIVMIDGNGETTLLSLPLSTDMRCLWMDETNTIYASPFNGVNQDGSATDIGNGLYRMAYGENSFTKVLSLPSSCTIWTICKDRKGYLYCGEYSVVNNVPILYKSTDDGITWSTLVNFNTVGYTTGGRHIHSVIFNKYNNALYAIVGEINTVFKSTDDGATWQNLNITLFDKGSSMIATPRGILIGSDSAYWCDIDLLNPDDTSHRRVSRIWANTVFGFRRSDLTGNIYAFCKIDSSVKSSSYMPQIDLNDDAAVEAYIQNHSSGNWHDYYESLKDYYPEDAMRPTHFAILVSRDNGINWEVLYRGETGAINADGIWTIGQFRNGECLCGHVLSTTSSSRAYTKPLVISEGRHNYSNVGVSVDGDIYAKTLSSTNVTPL